MRGPLYPPSLGGAAVGSRGDRRAGPPGAYIPRLMSRNSASGGELLPGAPGASSEHLPFGIGRASSSGVARANSSGIGRANSSGIRYASSSGIRRTSSLGEDLSVNGGLSGDPGLLGGGLHSRLVDSEFTGDRAPLLLTFTNPHIEEAYAERRCGEWGGVGGEGSGRREGG